MDKKQLIKVLKIDVNLNAIVSAYEEKERLKREREIQSENIANVMFTDFLEVLSEFTPVYNGRGVNTLTYEICETDENSSKFWKFIDTSMYEIDDGVYEKFNNLLTTHFANFTYHYEPLGYRIYTVDIALPVI